MLKKIDLFIALVQPDGKIYLRKHPANALEMLPIINHFTGDKLFDILVNETGYVKFEDNKFALKVITERSLNSVAMKMLGKIAEAVLVRRCKDDEEINLNWLSFAARKKIKYKTSERCIAIGTGLLSTKTEFPFRYNPTDTQRDVIWLDRESRQCVLMQGNNSVSGLEAGLQVKVSKNGVSYFLDSLVNIKYEVPVVYFDICDDYHVVAKKLYEKLPYGKIVIGEDFIQARAVDEEAFKEVLFYVEMVEALIAGRLSPDALINHKDVNDNPAIKSAITSAALSEIQLPNVTLP